MINLSHTERILLVLTPALPAATVPLLRQRFCWSQGHVKERYAQVRAQVPRPLPVCHLFFRWLTLRPRSTAEIQGFQILLHGPSICGIAAPCPTPARAVLPLASTTKGPARRRGADACTGGAIGNMFVNGPRARPRYPRVGWRRRRKKRKRS